MWQASVWKEDGGERAKRVSAFQPRALRRRPHVFFFFFQAEDGIRDKLVTGVQTCALPILLRGLARAPCVAKSTGHHWFGLVRQRRTAFSQCRLGNNMRSNRSVLFAAKQ